MATRIENELMGYAPVLRKYALYLTRESSQAADLFQDTAERIIRHGESLKPGTSFKAWSKTIMKNVYINGYRRTQTRLRKATDIEQLSPVSYSLERSQDLNLGEQHVFIERIEQAIDNLEDRMKCTFQMYRNGYKYQEIADELEQPIGTIKSRIHQARIYLKRELSEYRMAG